MKLLLIFGNEEVEYVATPRSWSDFCVGLLSLEMTIDNSSDYCLLLLFERCKRMENVNVREQIAKCDLAAHSTAVGAKRGQCDDNNMLDHMKCFTKA